MLRCDRARTRNEALVDAEIVPLNRSHATFMRYSSAMQALVSGPMSPIGKRVGRTVLLIAIVVLHLLLVLRLASRSPPESAARPAVLNVFTVPLSSGRGASSPPTKQTAANPAHHNPVVIVHRQSRTANDSPSSADAEAAPQANVAAGGCALARDVGDAIQQDVAAMAELDALPPTIRTSADAVMLWNGEWLDQGAMPRTGNPGSLRRVVEQVVVDAPVECRDAEAIGPVFIPIPERDHTVMIVIGSGIWRWVQLLAPATACAATDQATCPPLELPTANEQSVQ